MASSLSYDIDTRHKVASLGTMSVGIFGWEVCWQDYVWCLGSVVIQLFLGRPWCFDRDEHHEAGPDLCLLCCQERAPCILLLVLVLMCESCVLGKGTMYTLTCDCSHVWVLLQTLVLLWLFLCVSHATNFGVLLCSRWFNSSTKLIFSAEENWCMIIFRSSPKRLFGIYIK